MPTRSSRKFAETGRNSPRNAAATYTEWPSGCGAQQMQAVAGSSVAPCRSTHGLPTSGLRSRSEAYGERRRGPFGGSEPLKDAVKCRQSGIGRELGEYAPDHCTEVKTVTIKV